MLTMKMLTSNEAKMLHLGRRWFTLALHHWVFSIFEKKTTQGFINPIFFSLLGIIRIWRNNSQKAKCESVTLKRAMPYFKIFFFLKCWRINSTIVRTANSASSMYACRKELYGFEIMIASLKISQWRPILSHDETQMRNVYAGDKLTLQVHRYPKVARSSTVDFSRLTTYRLKMISLP